MTYDQAWSTCLFLAPAGQWRIPSTTEIELGRRMNAALFTGFKWFRSSSSSQDWGFWSYSPAMYDGWVSCNSAFTGCNDAWNGYYFPAALRCVSNS